MDTVYEAYALKYAERGGRRTENFMGGDPHDAPMPMDYFVWLLRSPEHTFVIDTGFSRAMADKRKRTYLRTPAEALALLDVDANSVGEVILTHLHYDHAGTFQDFPAAKFHLQDDEMNYATGRYMRFGRFAHGYEVEDVVGVVRLVYRNRVDFHRGVAQLAPNLSVHRIGGHTMGIQCVRALTRRGWLVIASDASHYYEHMENNRCFPTCFHVGDMVDGYATLRGLAESPQHIIPGHDPLVMQRYPAPRPELQGIVARLDVPPIT